MLFAKHSIPAFTNFIEIPGQNAIAVNLLSDRCFLLELQIAPTMQLTRSTEITDVLPEMSENIVQKAVKAISKAGKFDQFAITQLLYATNVLTMLFSAAHASYLVQLQIQPDPAVMLFQKLAGKPVSIAPVGNDIYIAFADQLQRLDYGKNQVVFKDLGQDRILQIAEFQGKLAILMFSNNLIMYDVVTQQQRKIKVGNGSAMITNEYSTVVFSRSGETLNLSVVEPDVKAIDGYSVYKYQFSINAQYQKISLLSSQYSDSFLLVFFTDKVNPPFCLAISQQEKSSTSHQILEMTGAYAEIFSVTVSTVVRIIESKDDIFNSMRNSEVDPLIAQMFDCTEPFQEMKEKLKKVNQIGEVKCQVTDFNGVFEASVYHQKYLLCKGLLLNDFPIQDFFKLSISLFQQFKIVKRFDEVHANIRCDQFVREAYMPTVEKLPEVVVFACLRYQELLPFLEFVVSRQEQRLDAVKVENDRFAGNLAEYATSNVPVYSMSNVRPLASFLQLIVENSCKFLDIVFKEFINSIMCEQLQPKIEQLDNLQTVVQSSVKIMQLLLETRENDQRYSLQEIVCQANYVIMSGRTFISISKIIKYFSSLGQSSSLLDINVPLTNDSAVQLGLHDQSFSNQELSQSTFVNDEVDQVVECNASILYTKEYGFYHIGEDMVVSPYSSADIPNYAELYKQLNMDGNTAIFSVISSICQLFAGGSYIRLTLRDILQYVLSSREQLKMASNFSIRQFEAAIFSIVLIFGYIKMMRNQNQTEIFTFLSDILPYVQNKTKITNQLFLLCKIFATIDSASSEKDSDINIISRSYDNYRLYNELLLLGAGSQADSALLRENLNAALQFLPLPFSMRDGLSQEQIKSLTGNLWAARLSQLACTRNQFNLARGLANFAPATPFSYQPTLWPYHPVETGTELYLRACLVDFVLNHAMQPLISFITQIRVFLNSFALTEGDSATNRRIASLYTQAALGELKWDTLYRITEESDISEEDIAKLRGSGYECKTSKLPYWKLPSALILYQSISDVEKRVILSYCIQNQAKQDFILVFLYQNDVYLCQQYMQHLVQTQTVNSRVFDQMQRKLAAMPKFLYARDLRKTTLFSDNDGQLAPAALLPNCFIDDMDKELIELEKSLAASENLSATQLEIGKKESEPAPIVIDQQAGMMNFLDLMRQNTRVQNVRCPLGMPYQQPVQQQPIYNQRFPQMQVNYAQQAVAQPLRVPDTAFQPMQLEAPVRAAAQPIVRQTKAQMLRDQANRAKIESQSKKEVNKISQPRQTIIGQKQVGIKLQQGYQNNLARQPEPYMQDQQQYTYGAYAYPNYNQPSQPAYDPYQPQPYQVVQYQANKQQTPANPFAKQPQPAQRNYAQQPQQTQKNYTQAAYSYPSRPAYAAAQQPAYQNVQQPAFNPVAQPSADLQYEAGKAAFKPSFKPSFQPSFQPSSQPSFNPSLEPSIQTATKTTAAGAQVRRATFAPAAQYYPSEPPMQGTAQFIPQTATKPSILKNGMNFRSQSPVVRARNGVAFDVQL